MRAATQRGHRHRRGSTPAHLHRARTRRPRRPCSRRCGAEACMATSYTERGSEAVRDYTVSRSVGKRRWFERTCGPRSCGVASAIGLGEALDRGSEVVHAADRGDETVKKRLRRLLGSPTAATDLQLRVATGHLSGDGHWPRPGARCARHRARSGSSYRLNSSDDAGDARRRFHRPAAPRDARQDDSPLPQRTEIGSWPGSPAFSVATVAASCCHWLVVLRQRRTGSPFAPVCA